VVAIGAAVQGGVLKGEISDVLLLDVTPLSLGIETMGGVFTKLIESNSTIPIRKSEVFSTASDNQPSVDIHVLQGERPMASDNKTLGRFMLTDIPPAPRGIPQVEVTFDIDANGIINVSAKDKGTGKVQNIKIESGNKLSDDEIKKMKDEAVANEKADKERLEFSQVKNELDSIVFQAEKMMKDFEEKTTEDDRKKIDDLIAEAKEILAGTDVEKMKDITKSLVESLQEISTKVYSQEQEKSGGAEPSMDSSTNTEAEEVEFEEVKG
jgi:molecular chaperone DnaK